MQTRMRAQRNETPPPAATGSQSTSIPRISTNHYRHNECKSQSDNGFEGIIPSKCTTSITADEVFNDEHDSVIWEDWSGSGGSHVDYGPDDCIPLEYGRYLGRGAVGDVYEARCRGTVVAVKRKFCRKRITGREKQEVEIMKKLIHPHVVDVVGTFTQGRIFGILLYPVAICDLATFFDDIESLYSGGLDMAQKDRISKLGLPSMPWRKGDRPERAFVLPKIGCLIGALKYLHEQRVLHRDLKPSNILLSCRRVWLTDFGYSVDFSARSTSETESGGRGTPKYFAPEVANYLPSGRAADIFSLGCVFLEMLSICLKGSIAPLTELRPIPDQFHSFQANLHRMPAWTDLLSSSIPCYRHALTEVMQMLARDPQTRPSAHDIHRRLSYIDNFNGPDELVRIFDDCCRVDLYSEHNQIRINNLSKKIDDSATEHKRQLRVLEKQHECGIGMLERKTSPEFFSKSPNNLLDAAQPNFMELSSVKKHLVEIGETMLTKLRDALSMRGVTIGLPSEVFTRFLPKTLHSGISSLSIRRNCLVYTHLFLLVFLSICFAGIAFGRIESSLFRKGRIGRLNRPPRPTFRFYTVHENGTKAFVAPDKAYTLLTSDEPDLGEGMISWGIQKSA